MDNHADNFIVNNNYMAGLVDSDFGVYIHRFFPRGKLQLRPTISFNNTNFNLIETCASYLSNADINHHVAYRKASKGKDKKEVTIKRQSKCIEFVDKVSGLCVTRKPQLKIVKEFCSSRLYNVDVLGWKQNNTPYTDHEKSLYDKIVELNLNYNYDNESRNYSLDWLAGMIDGDGSICFVIAKQKQINPVVDITTGSDTTKNNLFELFGKLNIKYNYRSTRSKAKKRLGKNKKKFHYNISIRRQADLLKLLMLLDGRLVAKQRQLELMIDYLERKKINRHNTDDIWDIVYKARFFNHNPNYNYEDISETNTRNTLKE
jgi:hypothetical protein